MIRAKIAQLAKLAAAAVVPLVGSLPAHAESGWGLLNMTQGVTDISRKIYALHMEIFWVCVIIALIVFGAMIYSIVTSGSRRAPSPTSPSCTTRRSSSSGRRSLS